MDIRTIVKILAVIAFVALAYKMWSMKSHHATQPMGYAFEDSDAEDDDEGGVDDDNDDNDEDDEYDMEDADYEDDMEDADYEDADYEDADYEDADYEVSTSSMSKVTMPAHGLLSPSSKMLPKPSVAAQDFAQYAPKELGAQNFLTATQWIGVNTQGSSLRNANYDIRANPMIAKQDVGPWAQSTIDPDVYTKPLF